MKSCLFAGLRGLACSGCASNSHLLTPVLPALYLAQEPQRIS